MPGPIRPQQVGLAAAPVPAPATAAVTGWMPVDAPSAPTGYGQQYPVGGFLVNFAAAAEQPAGAGTDAAGSAAVDIDTIDVFAAGDALGDNPVPAPPQVPPPADSGAAHSAAAVPAVWADAAGAFADAIMSESPAAVAAAAPTPAPGAVLLRCTLAARALAHLEPEETAARRAVDVEQDTARAGVADACRRHLVKRLAWKVSQEEVRARTAIKVQQSTMRSAIEKEWGGVGRAFQRQARDRRGNAAPRSVPDGRPRDPPPAGVAGGEGSDDSDDNYCPKPFRSRPVAHASSLVDGGDGADDDYRPQPFRASPGVHADLEDYTPVPVADARRTPPPPPPPPARSGITSLASVATSTGAVSKTLKKLQWELSQAEVRGRVATKKELNDAWRALEDAFAQEGQGLPGWHRRTVGGRGAVRSAFRPTTAMPSRPIAPNPLLAPQSGGGRRPAETTPGPTALTGDAAKALKKLQWELSQAEVRGRVATKKELNDAWRALEDAFAQEGRGLPGWHRRGAMRPAAAPRARPVVPCAPPPVRPAAALPALTGDALQQMKKLQWELSQAEVRARTEVRFLETKARRAVDRAFAAEGQGLPGWDRRGGGRPPPAGPVARDPRESTGRHAAAGGGYDPLRDRARGHGAPPAARDRTGTRSECSPSGHAGGWDEPMPSSAVEPPTPSGGAPRRPKAVPLHAVVGSGSVKITPSRNSEECKATKERIAKYVAATNAKQAASVQKRLDNENAAENARKAAATAAAGYDSDSSSSSSSSVSSSSSCSVGSNDVATGANAPVSHVCPFDKEATAGKVLRVLRTRMKDERVGRFAGFVGDMVMKVEVARGAHGTTAGMEHLKTPAAFARAITPACRVLNLAWWGPIRGVAWAPTPHHHALTVLTQNTTVRCGTTPASACLLALKLEGLGGTTHAKISKACAYRITSKSGAGFGAIKSMAWGLNVENRRKLGLVAVTTAVLDASGAAVDATYLGCGLVDAPGDELKFVAGRMAMKALHTVGLRLRGCYDACQWVGDTKVPQTMTACRVAATGVTDGQYTTLVAQLVGERLVPNMVVPHGPTPAAGARWIAAAGVATMQGQSAERCRAERQLAVMDAMETEDGRQTSCCVVTRGLDHTNQREVESETVPRVRCLHWTNAAVPPICGNVAGDLVVQGDCAPVAVGGNPSMLRAAGYGVEGLAVVPSDNDDAPRVYWVSGAGLLMTTCLPSRAERPVACRCLRTHELCNHRKPIWEAAATQQASVAWMPSSPDGAVRIWPRDTIPNDLRVSGAAGHPPAPEGDDDDDMLMLDFEGDQFTQRALADLNQREGRERRATHLVAAYTDVVAMADTTTSAVLLLPIPPSCD